MGGKNGLAGITGWGVAGLLGLGLMGQCTSKDTPPPQGARTAAAPPITRYVSARSLNCRLEPNSSAGISRGLSRNEAVQIVEERDSWVKVEGQPACWVMASYLSETTTAATPIASFAKLPPVSTPARATNNSRRSNPKPVKVRQTRGYDSEGCPCSGSRVCIGPRGGRYCITSGGNKRYGV